VFILFKYNYDSINKILVTGHFRSMHCVIMLINKE